MEVTVTAKKLEAPDNKYEYDGYTVYVGDHRILTVSTDCTHTLSKWLKEVQKQRSNTKQGALVVGVVASRHDEKGGDKDAPYDLLQLCVGSHCLLHTLRHSLWHGSDLSIPRAFQAFFANPRVVAVGMNMSDLSKRLERHHQLKIVNPMDLNRMAAAKGSSSEANLDLGFYDLDRLAMAVVGRHMYFERTEYEEEEEMMKMMMYPDWYRHELLSLKQVKYATLDAYLCFLIGSKLLDDDDKNKIGGSKKKMKKKKNMKATMGGASAK